MQFPLVIALLHLPFCFAGQQYLSYYVYYIAKIEKSKAVLPFFYQIFRKSCIAGL
jgi:hypothetical protein